MKLLKRLGNGGSLPIFRSDFSQSSLLNGLNDHGPIQWPGLLGEGRQTLVPSANILESEEGFTILLAAPGMEKEDFHISVENNLLEVKVEREDEHVEDYVQFTRKEYDYNAFCRHFNLPDSVQSGKTQAEYQNGVLKIHLPKTATAKRLPAKEIAVM